jgi:DNA-binding NarL/FixJ family response regulator
MNEKPVIRILLADDQASVRGALRLLLEQEPAFAVVAEAADVTGLLQIAAQHPANLLLLDWELPGLPISHLLRLLREEWPALQIIAMSSRPEAGLRAAQLGVAAFLSKGAPPETVVATLTQLPLPRLTWSPDQPQDSPVDQL